MGGEAGAAPDFLSDLARVPYEFDFFQALRRLECAHAELPRMGHAVRADQEPVRLGQQPSLAFAPATIAEFRPGREGHPPRLLVSFLGLLGPQGPMPLHVTEYVRDREINNADPTLARFLDIFNHRVLTLFFRAWAGAQQTVSHERPREDRFAEYVASLVGLGMGPMRGRDTAPDLAKLHYSGRFACQSRPPEGLSRMLSDFFGVPVTLEEFVGRWLPLDEPRRLRLGESPATGALGRTAVVGANVWDRQQKFRLRIGPIDFDAYERFLPAKARGTFGGWLGQLISLVRLYVGDELAFDLRLVLRAQSVPRAQLGRLGRLGWSTWTSTHQPPADASDLVLSPSAA